MDDHLADLLEKLQIKYTLVTHEPVYTVAESSKVMNDKFPVKNLLLHDPKTGRHVLVIMQGDKRLNTKLLADEMNLKKPQFAKADMLMDLLGVTPGSVSLFSLLHTGSRDIEVVLDTTLLNVEHVGFHPGSNDASVFISGADITKFIEHTGHSAVMLAL